MEKVRTSDFWDALAIWNAFDTRGSSYHNQLCFLQQRGILKQLVGDLDRALEDLTAALEIDHDDYECRRHRGYVNYVLGDE
ncbi:unnamed protein product [Calypogeia fissa]